MRVAREKDDGEGGEAKGMPTRALISRTRFIAGDLVLPCGTIKWSDLPRNYRAVVGTVNESRARLSRDKSSASRSRATSARLEREWFIINRPSPPPPPRAIIIAFTSLIIALGGVTSIR